MFAIAKSSPLPAAPSFPREPARLFVALILAAAIAFGPATAGAATDKTKPTVPGNFRVTAKTSFSITVAWTPSTDNSGNFTYKVWSTGGGATVTLPKTATTHTFSPPFYPGNSYTLGIQAVDAAGNYSTPISVSTTTPPDTTPPTTAPVLSATSVGSTYVSLAWTPAQDNGPFLFYQVLVNGSPSGWDPGSNRAITIQSLQPATTYSFTVRARDYGNNWSPVSAPVTITTNPPNAADVTPPSTPANLRENHWAGSDTEINLGWDPSVDDFDAPANIRYDVYVNGVVQDTLFGAGRRSIVYGEPGENTVEVVATDTAGNSSAPATVTVFF